MSDHDQAPNITATSEQLKHEAIARYEIRPELKYWFLLRNTVFKKQYAEAMSLLTEHPYLLHTRDFTGETVLHFLAIENDLDGVAWLHEQGFDLNTSTNNGDPVIFDVASLGYKDLLFWFKTNGADFQIKNKTGQDLFAYLKYHNKIEMVTYIDQMLA